MIPPKPTPDVAQNPDKSQGGLKGALINSGLKPMQLFSAGPGGTQASTEKVDATKPKPAGLFDQPKSSQGGLFNPPTVAKTANE